MRLTEAQLRRLIRHSLREDRQNGPHLMMEKGEGIFGMLKDLISGMFGMLGDIGLKAAEGLDRAMADTAGPDVANVQKALGREKGREYRDLKPHEDNVDKAAWALGTVKALVEAPGNDIVTIASNVDKATYLKSLSPPTPEEADEWEKGEDANKLKIIYKGIGQTSGTLTFLATHLNSAKEMRDKIDHSAPLDELLQAVAKAGEYISGPLITGLKSAIAAVDKADISSDYEGRIGIVETQGQMLTEYALEGYTTVKELMAKAEELAAATDEGEELAKAAEGMPEGLLRHYIRSLLS